MATFFLLPPRLQVGQRFGGFLASLFPGACWQHDRWYELAEAVASAGGAVPESYVVFREDLADECQVEDCLVQDFGAEPGDEILEIALGLRADELAIRRWQVGEGEH